MINRLELNRGIDFSENRSLIKIRRTNMVVTKKICKASLSPVELLATSFQ